MKFRDSDLENGYHGSMIKLPGVQGSVIDRGFPRNLASNLKSVRYLLKYAKCRDDEREMKRN